MKNLLMLALALVALGTTTTLGLAQEPRAIKIDSTMPVQPRIPALACCECLGKVTTLDLSTGQSGPIDPLWKVNNVNAYVVSNLSNLLNVWTVLPPANWIQPVASSTPSDNIAPGVYRYTVKFYIPECAIRSRIQLTGKFSADNSANAFLDVPGQSVGSCVGPTCYQADKPLTTANSTWLNPGYHTLVIDVKNNEGYTGLIVNAKLTRQCVSGTSGPAGSQPTEPNN
jgi:hypothetical protein